MPCSASGAKGSASGTVAPPYCAGSRRSRGGVSAPAEAHDPVARAVAVRAPRRTADPHVAVVAEQDRPVRGRVDPRADHALRLAGAPAEPEDLRDAAEA